MPGRNISDNVLIAFEMIHYIKRKNKCQDGDVALKLDRSKAYDIVSWQYLWHRMQVMGFDAKWIRWVKLCVTTIYYMVCMNGNYVGPITPSRGRYQIEVNSE